MANPFEDLEAPEPARKKKVGAGGKLKPHKGSLMLSLGIASLFVAPLIVAPITWLMARSDLREMNAGRMDPAGRKQTQTARMLAMISTIFWPLVLCPCCGVAVFYQMSTGDNLIAGLGSRRITEKEFKRVNEGMTKKQVTDLIGQPAKTETRGGRANWYWYEKDGRATFTLDFDDRGRVRDRGVDTPD